MSGEEKVLDKVRKLLAKAESTNHEAEAEVFYAKAQALMLEHAISEAQIADAKPAGSAQEQPVVHLFVYSTSDANVPPKKLLLNAIAKTNRVRAVFIGGSRHEQTASLVGFQSDVDFVELLYTSLLLQGSAAAGRAWSASRNTSGRKAYVTQFLLGFATRVEERLVEANRAAMAAAEDREPGVGLVLFGRDESVEARLRQEFPRLRSSSIRTGGYNGSARGAGMDAGSRADLSGGRSGVQGSRGALAR